MAQIEGKVVVYESTDGGTGSQGDTRWTFFVENKNKRMAVDTTNHFHVETMLFAIKTNRVIKVTFDDESQAIAQARLEIKYEQSPE